MVAFADSVLRSIIKEGVKKPSGSVLLNWTDLVSREMNRPADWAPELKAMESQAIQIDEL